jgi:hypothetical protein
VRQGCTFGTVEAISTRLLGLTSAASCWACCTHLYSWQGMADPTAKHVSDVFVPQCWGQFLGTILYAL